MTQLEAETQRDNNNTLLGMETATIRWDVFKNWPKVGGYAENYEITLYPTKYLAQFGAATDEQLQGFGRIGVQITITQWDAAGGSTAYVDQWDLLAAADPILQPYLGL